MSTVTLDALVNRAQGRGSWLGLTPEGRQTLAYMHAHHPAAAVQLVERGGPGDAPPATATRDEDLGAAMHGRSAARVTGRGEGESASLAAALGVTAEDIAARARRDGLDFFDAARAIADERGYRQALDDAHAKYGGQRAVVPWLDTTKLATPPRPWSDEDYERDARRAQAAGHFELTREVWQAYAEQGQDAVHELLTELLVGEVSEVRGAMENARHEAQRQVDAARAREAAIEAEVQAQLRTRAERAVQLRELSEGLPATVQLIDGGGPLDLPGGSHAARPREEQQRERDALLAEHLAGRRGFDDLHGAR